MKSIALLLIKLYQKTFSPDHGLLRVFFPYGACKYHPTCSQFTYDAVIKFGILKGTTRGAQRILRCHPWSRGGYDPVVNHSNKHS
jgi:uncharacterized protein